MSKKKEGLRYPPIDDLVSKAHNKYELVIAASKRAREIVDGKIQLIDTDATNPISIATQEIAEGKIVIENPLFEKQNGGDTEIQDEISIIEDN